MLGATQKPHFLTALFAEGIFGQAMGLPLEALIVFHGFDDEQHANLREENRLLPNQFPNAHFIL